MYKTLQTYYEEELEKIQQLIRKAKKLIGADQVGGAIDLLVQYDEYLSEALDLILNKRALTNNERKRHNNTIFIKDYEIKANQIAEAVNDKINHLRNRLALKNQNFPYKDYTLHAHLIDLFETTAPFKRILTLQRMLALSRCVCQIQVSRAGKTNIGAGILVEGNEIITTYALIPNAQVAQTAEVRVDFIDDQKENVWSYTLDTSTWIGDENLNFAKIKIKGTIASWHLYSGTYDSPGSGQQLILLDSGLTEGMLGQMYSSRLQQFADPFLTHYPVNDVAIQAGTPVFSKAGNIVGIHHGDPNHPNRMTTWSAIQNYETKSPEAAASESSPKKVDADKNESDAKQLFFGTHHQYTCDRVRHNDQFTPFIDVADQNQQDRLHFFFMHGGERQEHIGLFNRFVARLDGKAKDHIKQAHRNDAKVKPVIVNFPEAGTLESIKIQLPLLVLLALQLEENQIEKIEQKCLADALSVENSLIYGLEQKDKVCLLITINEGVWDPKLTPEAATWFIEAFCQKSLPADCPEFFIFFAIDYDDYDDDEKQERQEEVQQALNNGKYIQTVFPVLDMVEYRDIKNWFSKYAVFWNHDRKRYRLVMERHFDRKAAPWFMEDVQDILEDIIETVNQENT